MEKTAVDYWPAARVSDVSENTPKRVVVREKAVAIYNLDGRFYATDDCCSHGLASLSMGFVEGDWIECPLHAGAFDIKTGKAVKAPCTEDIQTFPVRVENGTIFVGVG